MTGLVDNLLDVSRVNRGVVELDRVPLDIRGIVTDAVQQVDPLVRARRHHPAVHFSPDAATVLWDNKRLVQIVANLLNNSAQYTPEGGHILLRTEVRDASVLIGVSDDGIGMEPELASRVFELFAQAERTPDRASGGLGLGLALVKRLVELHGGSVACASDGKGKGSSFTVSLPLVPVTDNGLEARQSARFGKPAGKPLRIMVVDDNADAAQMLAMLLAASGHQTTVVYGARQALEQSRTEASQVCVLDIGLQEIDGNELARRLTAQPATAGAMLIAVTGYGQEHDRKAALDAGISHHFVKPVDPAKLVAVLADIAGWSARADVIHRRRLRAPTRW